MGLLQQHHVDTASRRMHALRGRWSTALTLGKDGDAIHLEVKGGAFRTLERLLDYLNLQTASALLNEPAAMSTKSLHLAPAGPQLALKCAFALRLLMQPMQSCNQGCGQQ